MTTKRIVIISIITGLLLLISAYIFSFPMKKTKYSNENLIDFVKEDFTDAQKVYFDASGEKIYEDVLVNKEKVVHENANFKLILDETTTYFKLLDKTTNKTWNSNPTDGTSNGDKSTVVINYLETTSSSSTSKSVNNYKLSINHGTSIDYDKEGRKTYSINYLEDGFQIFYSIRNLEINSLMIPRFLKADVYRETLKILESRGEESFNLAYTFKNIYSRLATDNNIYQINEGTYTNMSSNDLKDLYEVYYPVDRNNLIEVLGEYSAERAQEENAEHGYYTSFDDFYLELAIQVKLTDTGIETSLINQSIKESPKHNITEVSIYPMFGAISANSETGYLVVPDGSGSVINFDNGKGGTTNPYKGRMYGEDLALFPVNNVEKQKLILPIFGLVGTDTGFAAILTEGDSMAFINANTSSSNNPYNTINASFVLREQETVSIGSGMNTYTVTLFTKEIADTDYTVSFRFLSSSNNNYTGIAKEYQNNMIDEMGLIKKDNTNNPVLTLELLGSYTKNNFFLGVPYTTQQSLTSFKQAQTIVNKFAGNDIENIKVLYNGAVNGGLTQKIANKTKFESSLGGKKEFNKMKNELSKIDVDVFVNVDLGTVNKYTRPFDKYKYTSRKISGANAMKFDYDLPSNVIDNDTGRYVVSPLYYETLYNKLTKKNHLDNIQFTTLGSSLAGNYTKKNTLHKQDALNLQKQLLNEIDQDVMLSQPLGFAIPYTDFIIDLSTSTTLYSMVDYEIPLVQLALSGFIDYTTESINLTSSRSIDYQFMKALETGSNLKYTLSYESSEQLLNTKYNNFFSTFYGNWEDIINGHYNEMNNSKIHEGSLIAHERLQNNVYMSTYSNGVKVIVNYNPYQVTIDNNVILGLDYYVGVI